MPPGAANVLAIAFLVVVAAALLAVIVISHRNHVNGGATAGQAEFAGRLVELDDEVRYAEAFAEPGSRQAAEAANARIELDDAYAQYLAAYGPDAVPGGNPGARYQNLATTLARVRAHLGGTLTDHPVGAGGQRDLTGLRVGGELPVVVGPGSAVFEVALWLLGLVPGIVFAAKRRAAENYFRRLDQRIRANSAQIDVYLGRRVQVLRDLVPSLGASHHVTAASAALGIGGVGTGGSVAGGLVTAGLANSREADRNTAAGHLDSAYRELALRPPAELGASPEAVAEARRLDANTMREVTAARTLYNDTVAMWNADIFAWPTKMVVAARAGYTTRPLVVAAPDA